MTEPIQTGVVALNPTSELFAALSAFQGEVEDATKNAKNPHFQNTYANLAEVLQTVRPLLSKHGLSVTQFPGPFDRAASTASLTTILGHKGGGYVAVAATIPVAKADAQGDGGGLTYLRRYSLAAVLGISQEDDDGNAATDKPKKRAAGKPAPAADTAPPMLPDDLLAAYEAVGPGQMAEFKALAVPLSKLLPADQARLIPTVREAMARAKQTGEA